MSVSVLPREGSFEEILLEDAPLGAVLQGLNFVDEVADVVEMTIYRCVTHVCDLIQGMKMIHHLGTHNMRRDLPFKVRFQLLDDLVHRALQRLCTDRTLFTRFHHSAQNLLLIKRLAASVSLENSQFRAFDFLVRRESMTALHTLPATADAPAILRQPRVNHLVFETAAF